MKILETERAIFLEMIVELLSLGMIPDEILTDYEDIKCGDISRRSIM